MAVRPSAPLRFDHYPVADLRRALWPTKVADLVLSFVGEANRHHLALGVLISMCVASMAATTPSITLAAAVSGDESWGAEKE